MEDSVHGFADIATTPLWNADGAIVGYAAGTEAEVARMASEVWSSDAGSSSMTEIECFKEYAIARVTATRARLEVDGVIVGSSVFPTDPSSQIKYIAILFHVSRNRDYSGVWKTANEGFVRLDATAVEIMCMTVMDHIQRCFAWEQHVLSMIDATDSIEGLKSLDTSVDRPVGQGLSRTLV